LIVQDVGTAPIDVVETAAAAPAGSAPTCEYVGVLAAPSIVPAVA
jgi:hypothetical protein